MLARCVPQEIQKPERVGLDDMKRRSVFSLLAVEQFRLCAEQEKWCLTPKLVNFAKAATSRLTQTQISEDGFNRERTDGGPRPHEKGEQREGLRSLGQEQDRELSTQDGRHRMAARSASSSV